MGDPFSGMCRPMCGKLDYLWIDLDFVAFEGLQIFHFSWVSQPEYPIDTCQSDLNPKIWALTKLREVQIMIWKTYFYKGSE